MVRLVLFWSCICHVSFHLVVSHHRSSVSLLAFTLLCDETLRPPVGQRSPQPLKGTKGEESQPNQAGNNVDGPHTSHDINILVVLEFAVKLPWLASRASFRLHLHESRKWPDDDRQHTLSKRSSIDGAPGLGVDMQRTTLQATVYSGDRLLAIHSVHLSG